MYFLILILKLKKKMSELIVLANKLETPQRIKDLNNSLHKNLARLIE